MHAISTISVETTNSNGQQEAHLLLLPFIEQKKNTFGKRERIAQAVYMLIIFAVITQVGSMLLHTTVTADYRVISNGMMPTSQQSNLCMIAKS
jgi:signal peptidase I